ncbi:MAG: hypothetical protein K9J16_08815 [Melioribacteraceae bacterium]|nr:hypothetical protein [Melioribacteraceae bacterium]MCF8353979.1 hypothetical protein [Melioribacteraceae bacterium]MCF8393707.1 hypothetical protein [Melioribacteraceae bacterium]MCF8419551.1 hypothetical protein [Melioribacteraceae bacterium]
MVKKVPRKSYESTDYSKFLKVSKNFADGAEVAADYEYYNAAGVLIIHAAIALADAVTIRFASAKCTGDNHYEIIKLLKEAAPADKQKTKAITQFEKLIDHKNAVSYQGEIYRSEDIQLLQKHFDRFRTWVESVLQ